MQIKGEEKDTFQQIGFPFFSLLQISFSPFSPLLLPSSILLNRTWFHFHGWKITSDLKAIAILFSLFSFFFSVLKKYQTYFPFAIAYFNSFHLLYSEFEKFYFILKLKFEDVSIHIHIQEFGDFPIFSLFLSLLKNHLYRHPKIEILLHIFERIWTISFEREWETTWMVTMR